MTEKERSEKLNHMEMVVFHECVKNADWYNEQGGFCCDEIDCTDLGITENQLKGYLSQLVQKGLIESCEDGYFTHTIIDYENL